jgi:hypothetical protein
VYRELLLKKLNDYSISDLWLRDYLSNRFQFVSIEELKSQLRKNTHWSSSRPVF